MLSWLLFLFFAIVFYVRVIKPHSYWKERNLPYKKPWFIVGNMGAVVFRIRTFSDNILDLYNSCKGRYLGVYQFLEPVLLIKDPDLIKQITIKDFDNFMDHRTLISEETDPLFGNNLFSLKGQRWREMRATLSPAFTSSKMRAIYVLINECAENFTNYFLKQSKTEKKHISVEMKDIFTRYANDVIATAAFGIKCDSLEDTENEFYVMGKETSDFRGLRGLKLFGYSLSPMLMKLFKVKIFGGYLDNFFRNIVLTTIDTREKECIIRPDMIHLLMEARKGQLNHEDSATNAHENIGFATVEESHIGKQTGKRRHELTDDEIVAQAILFFLAGFESISTALCHMANELAVNPDVQKTLQEEVDETFETGGGKITYENILKMKYLDMVISETLRKWPPGLLLDRMCTHPYVIQPTQPHEKPLHLAKGSICWIPAYAIHRDPANFPEPERFDPERFSEENKNNIKPMTYVPFGLGPRNCIGSRFALLEAKTLFVHLLRRFNIVVTEKTQVPIRMSKTDFHLRAEKGFWLGLQLRNEK